MNPQSAVHGQGTSAAGVTVPVAHIQLGPLKHTILGEANVTERKLSTAQDFRSVSPHSTRTLSQGPESIGPSPSFLTVYFKLIE